jgi:hypothetical protein
MVSDSSASALPHVYRLSPLRLVILEGISLVLLAIPACFLMAGPKAIGMALVMFLCVAPTVFILLFTAWYPRLTVMPEGLRVRGAIGYSSLLIPWSNIERVWMRANKEGLILREPLQSRAAARWKNWTGMTYMGGKFFDDEQQRYIDEQRYVPLQSFGYWLRHSELETELAGYLPALADDMRAQEPGYRLEQSKYNRKIVWVFVISAVIMAGTFLTANYAQHQPPAQRAAFEEGNRALGLFAGRAYALSLGIYALLNIRVAASFWRRKMPSYAAFWLFFAVIQILLVVGIFAS